MENIWLKIVKKKEIKREHQYLPVAYITTAHLIVSCPPDGVFLKITKTQKEAKNSQCHCAIELNYTIITKAYTKSKAQYGDYSAL